MEKYDLTKEFEYYIAHQAELVEKYNGRYIVIVGSEVVGDYDDTLKAIREASKKYKLGTFLVQKCEPGEESFTMTFHSRVYAQQ